MSLDTVAWSQGFTLVDATEDTGNTLKGRVEFANGALCIYLDGYGDCCSAPGHGTPILLELREASPTLAVWSDIKQEDPTHIIDLNGAKEHESGN